MSLLYYQPCRQRCRQCKQQQQRHEVCAVPSHALPEERKGQPLCGLLLLLLLGAVLLLMLRACLSCPAAILLLSSIGH